MGAAARTAVNAHIASAKPTSAVETCLATCPLEVPRLRGCMSVRPWLVANKNPLWDHAMHALADVDDLRHTTVSHDGGQRVCLLAADRDNLLTRKPLDCLLNCDLHRLIQILVITHENPVSPGFRPGPIRFQVLAYDGLNFDLLVGTFERRQIDLTVALPTVGI